MVTKLIERIFVLIAVISLVFVGPTVACFAGNFTLAWDQNPEDDLAGYYLYYKEGSSIVANATDAVKVDVPLTLDGFDPQQPAYKVKYLKDDMRYYFVVSAYNDSGESLFSEEVSGMNGNADAPDSDSDGGGSGCFITAVSKDHFRSVSIMRRIFVMKKP